ncbi:GntR family transcriptional regulator [Dactylosporangium sp. CA-092794]|uniref:GntR family transcriptional regulator n=1 Tax=Dactylosporangium sp. CA-092794 TaxID=3239929 RepID=UPI003D92965F
MSLTDDVYRRLKEQILAVARTPGDMLNEAQLADEFGVSKTPVREALRLLSQTGWVVVIPRKGYIVRPVELRDVRDIFAIRRMLEPPLAELAAGQASERQLDHLETLLEQQREAGVDQALEAARSFHLMLAGIAGSRRVHLILEDLVDEVRRLHYLLPHVEGYISSSDEVGWHALIVAALREKDGPRSAALVSDHLNEVAKTLVRGFAGV